MPRQPLDSAAFLLDRPHGQNDISARGRPPPVHDANKKLLWPILFAGAASRSEREHRAPVELVFSPEIRAPADRLSPKLNHGLSLWRSVDAKATQIMVYLMQSEPRGTKRKNLCPTERSRSNPPDEIRLLTAQPRINYRVSREESLRFIFRFNSWCEEPSDCGSFEGLNRHSAGHKIGEFAARININFPGFGEERKRREKADEVAERAGKKHASFSLARHASVVTERFH